MKLIGWRRLCQTVYFDYTQSTFRTSGILMYTKHLCNWTESGSAFSVANPLCYFSSMKQIFTPFLFALLAAAGNAIFVFGQKKSLPEANPFIFLACSVVLCALLLITASFISPLPVFKNFLSSNWKAIIFSAIGLFITYVGFYLLYSRFGASFYIIYAVISIVTTSILVGVVIFRETFNVYYVLSICSAFLTIVLFFIGQRS